MIDRRPFIDQRPPSPDQGGVQHGMLSPELTQLSCWTCCCREELLQSHASPSLTAQDTSQAEANVQPDPAWMMHAEVQTFAPSQAPLWADDQFSFLELQPTAAQQQQMTSDQTWTQVCNTFHNWVLQLVSSRCVERARVNGAEMKDNHVLEHQQKGCRPFVSAFLPHSHDIHVSAIVDNNLIKHSCDACCAEPPKHFRLFCKPVSSLSLADGLSHCISLCTSVFE